MEEAQQQNLGTLQGIQEVNEKNHTNGSSSNLKIFSKTDLFNNLNTEMSEIPDHDIYSQEIYSKLIGGDDKLVSQQLNQIIQQALYPYQEKIRQLEEIQQQKDNQITALFYTIKKMDDIIKKIESEQTKTQGTTRTVRKTATTVSNNTAGTTSSNRSASSAKGQQLGSNQMSQSTVLPSQTGGAISRKPSVPSLLDSKKSGQNMSKSTLHEPSSSKADSNRNSKVSTPASRVAKEASEPKKILKSKLGNNEGDQKVNSQQEEQKQKKTETDHSNIQNNIEVDSASNTNKQQSNQSNGKTDNSNYNSSPPMFLHDLTNDEHLIDNSSAKNGSDKDKNLLNNSNNINEDSMLI
ncbi:hypothetical protein TTHERM_00497330 (macronuclear) [Tetrahymena thermophila SB210]|uniref:Uncharacterized protein n=1 Tax=Tetrahymena thermophila (strain SB210) TaxID=312017 RepID=I7M4M5_TETTS|nr:hypothetical protein TTHERM_00497330 [Tetrahymena thermophila SB210]EAS07680.3 hypothetical protein TTHERM_00497330 [Tetrahymena thermophila SB210]|eukprot:XP_001027922.3 hypothetical protein TTHERM_00497330 [Tetrahymena thermophila SB210]